MIAGWSLVICSSRPGPADGTPPLPATLAMNRKYVASTLASSLSSEGAVFSRSAANALILLMSSPVGSPAWLPKRSLALVKVSQKALSEAATPPPPPPPEALAPLDELAASEGAEDALDGPTDETAEELADALLAAEGVPPLLVPPQAASARAATARTGARARGVFIT